MTAEQFKIKLEQAKRRLPTAINKELPVNIGKKSVDIFTENFQHEGFEDVAIEPWKEVKRRQNPRTKGAAKTRKILTGTTGDLGRSIKYDIMPHAVVVYSDVPYAAVHNEGLRAGRGKGFTMPKRQFIGDSQKINEMIETEIDNLFNKILP